MSSSDAPESALPAPPDTRTAQKAITKEYKSTWNPTTTEQDLLLHAVHNTPQLLQEYFDQPTPEKLALAMEVQLKLKATQTHIPNFDALLVSQLNTTIPETIIRNTAAQKILTEKIAALPQDALKKIAPLLVDAHIKQQMLPQRSQLTSEQMQQLNQHRQTLQRRRQQQDEKDAKDAARMIAAHHNTTLRLAKAATIAEASLPTTVDTPHAGVKPPDDATRIEEKLNKPKADKTAAHTKAAKQIQSQTATPIPTKKEPLLTNLAATGIAALIERIWRLQEKPHIPPPPTPEVPQLETRFGIQVIAGSTTNEDWQDIFRYSPPKIGRFIFKTGNVLVDQCSLVLGRLATAAIHTHEWVGIPVAFDGFGQELIPGLVGNYNTQVRIRDIQIGKSANWNYTSSIPELEKAGLVTEYIDNEAKKWIKLTPEGIDFVTKRLIRVNKTLNLRHYPKPPGIINRRFSS